MWNADTSDSNKIEMEGGYHYDISQQKATVQKTLYIWSKQWLVLLLVLLKEKYGLKNNSSTTNYRHCVIWHKQQITHFRFKRKSVPICFLQHGIASYFGHKSTCISRYLEQPQDCENHFDSCTNLLVPTKNKSILEKQCPTS